MTLGEYLKTLSIDERAAFAKRCGTSPDYLAQIGYDIRKPKVELAIAIDRESSGAVSCESLLPDVDWPYLRTKLATEPPPTEAAA